jgi:hypothetical protein
MSVDANAPAETPESLRQERDDLQDRLLRLAAEFDNYRKRTDRERRELTDAVAADLMRDIVLVVDDLERALAASVDAADPALRSGVELIHRQLLDVLRRRGAEPFESVGRTVAIDELVRLVRPKATVREGRLETQITNVMIYGNVTFAGTPLDLTEAIGPLTALRPIRLTFPPAVPERDDKPLVEDTVWGLTFGSVPLGSSVLMADSEGRLSLSDNQGDAARRLGLAVDRPVTITAR